ncbi:MAG: transposase [Candidatus Nealsonbacteria bacterium]|nr:transposase [Candidatus Nealsonbacteria bacterium]
MYEYRRMTPQQRKAAVEERGALGFPWHRPPHPESEEGWYLISAASYEHQHHFQSPAELTALKRRLLEALGGLSLPCAGWVVMPNHYHLLTRVPELSVLGRALGAVHGRSSRYANQRDRTPGRRVWFKYSDRKVRSQRHYYTCLHYILINPMKHRFAKKLPDWPWSCVHSVIAQQGQQWVEDLQRDYPLRDFGHGSDD